MLQDVLMVDQRDAPLESEAHNLLGLDVQVIIRIIIVIIIYLVEGTYVGIVRIPNRVWSNL